MTKAIGQKVLDTLNVLKAQGLVVSYKKNGVADVYLLRGDRYRIEVIINPPTWLGLEFHLLDEEGESALTYDINTDLYNLSLPKYLSFAREIESEIIGFLESLVEERILVGTRKGRLAMVIPRGAEFVLVWKGRFFTASKSYETVIEAQSRGEFRSLHK